MPRVSEIEEDVGQSIEQSGLLPKGLPALLYVRVATINGCPF